MYWRRVAFVNWTAAFEWWHSGPDSRNDPITVKKWSDHQFFFSSRFLHPMGFHELSCFDRIMIPSDPARYVDRCWIRNFITTIGHFISNITIVKIQKLLGRIYWNMISLVSTVCIFSMTLITYSYLSNMACPNRVVSWANTVCVHWTGHDALVSALINDVATPPIVTSWIYIISLTFFIQSRPRNFNSKIHSEWFMSIYDSIGKKMFGFVYSRSDEPIVIGVCGMRSADQDHMIVSEPIASGSFLGSGLGVTVIKP